jgi:NAD(P)-dependent dehydrogenase (short-subunit alcohol dehydrogenase family)
VDPGHGGVAEGIACDTTDEEQVQAMVARVRRLTAVDILVNNAGILGGLSVLEMPLERWQRQLAVNLTGTFSAPSTSPAPWSSTRRAAASS